MDRREFLKLSIAGTLSPVFLKSSIFTKLADETQPIYGGWVYSSSGRDAFIQRNENAFLSQLDNQIRGTGARKIVCLWPYLEKAMGGKPLVPHYQETGDCVGHAYGLGIDILTAIQCYRELIPQRWVAKAATEIIYGGGRVQIGKSRIGGAGCAGVWAGEFVKQYGVLLRHKYLNGKYDFTRYSGQAADKWGRIGVGVDLQPLCKLHPIRTVTLVKSWEECRDAVANGYPVTMCSNIGFRTSRGRDKDGFLSPGGTWYHAMLIAGIDDTPPRPGGLCINSWGSNWVDGPTRYNQPAGSFWIDASVIDRAMRQGDSIALSSYQGYPLQQLDYNIW